MNPQSKSYMNRKWSIVSIVLHSISKYVSLDKFIVVPTPKSIQYHYHIETDTRPPVTKIDALLPSIIL
ncbi:hypothetical protein OTUT144_1905 [Orientia tsutsugamushi str. UT144]|uniref:Uncharacterized protein n=1 Tax=Orientia tsutsugamushi str. UT144 TaxID=1441384 RepID=A0A0F3RIU2_ORITS|nr:hypothetical protein OTUT144_1905 [Orientia tsutsugamushi str. UT144]